MEEVPKIVRERLQAASKVEVHPDPNLLAAYAEKSLTAREQAQVLDHLAVCAECRDVVAVAAPELQAQVAVAAAAGGFRATAPMPAQMASPAKSKWPSLRWVTVAACVVVVAGAGLFLQRRNQTAAFKNSSAPQPQGEAIAAKTEPVQKTLAEADSRLEARLQDAAPPVATLDGKKLAPVETTRRDKAREKLRTYDLPMTGRSVIALQKLAPSQPGTPPPPPTLPTAIAPGAAGGSAYELSKVTEAKNKKEDALADKAPNQTDSISAFRSTESVEVRSQNEVVTVESAASAVSTDTASTATGERALKDSEAKAAAAKPAGSGTTAGYVGGLARALHQQLQAPVARWTLSPDGKLTRSVDQGKSWQTVQLATAEVLRALCLNGSEVWVGGGHGVLFYSSDNGANWKQIKPTVGGQVLTADITHIDFPEPEHGTLTTADKQTWTTADGGETWQKK